MDMGDLEDQLGEDALILVQVARMAAALQPDGSAVPQQRCLVLAEEVEDMTHPSQSLYLSTMELTYARRIMDLVVKKV